MAGRERLRAALTCHPVDELPVSLQGMDPRSANRRYRDSRWDPGTLPMLLTQDPVDRVVELLGPEQYSLMMIDAEKELLGLIDTAALPIMRKLDDVLKTGVEPVIWLDGSEMAVPPYAGPDRFRRLVFPVLQTAKTTRVKNPAGRSKYMAIV